MVDPPDVSPIGAAHEFDVFLAGTTYRYVDLVLPNGSRVHYPRISSGTGYIDAVFEHTSSPTRFFKSRITWNGKWNLDRGDQCTQAVEAFAHVRRLGVGIHCNAPSGSDELLP